VRGLARWGGVGRERGRGAARIASMRGFFVPGWGASASLYRRGMPAGWTALEPPTFRATGGELEAYSRWLERELGCSRAPLALAGHSMGGALALLAAAELPELVERLILVSPAGLPLDKPLHTSAATFVGQVARGCYPAGGLCRSLAQTAAAPRAALRLARRVHELDLTGELEPLRARAIPCTVIGCASDTLTTPAHCRRLATLLSARYRELDAAEGHIWMVAAPERLAAELRK
jgi:pimeloyl-ACP methyl ester carboxylesterase